MADLLATSPHLVRPLGRPTHGRSPTFLTVEVPTTRALLVLLCLVLAGTAAVLLYLRRPSQRPLVITLAVFAVAMALAAVALAAALLAGLM